MPSGDYLHLQVPGSLPPCGRQGGLRKASQLSSSNGRCWELQKRVPGKEGVRRGSCCSHTHRGGQLVSQASATCPCSAVLCWDPGAFPFCWFWSLCERAPPACPLQRVSVWGAGRVLMRGSPRLRTWSVRMLSVLFAFIVHALFLGWLFAFPAVKGC